MSTSPAATELLFALELGDRVVAVSEYCDWPPQARQLPKIGAASAQSVSIEAIVALQPDLVLCLYDAHRQVIESLDRLNITVLAIGPQSLAELYDEARWLGQLCGANSQAQRFVSELQGNIRAARQQIPDLPRPLRVFYEVWDDPLMSVASGSYIDELLELAALKNVIGNVDMAYPQVSHEAVIAADPEIILAPGDASSLVTTRWSQRPGWQDVSAVRSERIYLIEGDWVSRCGPRLPLALRQIIEQVYGVGNTSAAVADEAGR